MLTRPQRFRAEQLSSYVNETHKMLLNPVAHAEYILGLNGVEIGEEEHVDDQEFIMDIFEQRSELEDCESPDAAKQLSNINQGTCDISVCNYDPLVDGTLQSRPMKFRANCRKQSKVKPGSKRRN
jgi:DnaJ-domain-containing protein 1